MRIAILLSAYPVASETFIFDQIAGLVESGCEIAIFPERETHAPSAAFRETVQNAGTPEPYAFRPVAALSRALREPVPWRSLQVWKYKLRAASLRLYFEAACCAKHGAFDAIHCHFGINGIRGAMLREIGALKAKNLVTSFYGYDVSEFVRSHRAPYRELFQQGDLFLPLSMTMRNKLHSMGCPPEKMQVHRLGVDLERFKPAPAVSREGPLRVLSVARLVEKKGVEWGIRAVAAARPVPVHYRILGDGPQKPRLQSLIKELGVEDSIRIEGWKDRSEIAEALRQCDVLLAPSIQASNGDEEGTPTAIIEAMATARPVVSSRHASIPEVVEDEATGILTAERDFERIAAALVRLSRDLELRRHMGLAGRRVVEERHNIRKLNASLLSYLRPGEARTVT